MSCTFIIESIKAYFLQIIKGLDVICKILFI